MPSAIVQTYSTTFSSKQVQQISKGQRGGGGHKEAQSKEKTCVWVQLRVNSFSIDPAANLLQHLTNVISWTSKHTKELIIFALYVVKMLIMLSKSC